MEFKKVGPWYARHKVALPKSVGELMGAEKIGLCYLENLKVCERSIRDPVGANSFVLSDMTGSLGVMSEPRYRRGVDLPSCVTSDVDNYNSETWEEIVGASQGDSVDVVLRRIRGSGAYELVNMVRRG